MSTPLSDPPSPLDNNIFGTPREVETDLTLVVLAAGGGTRMRSALPKPFHTVAGRSMVEHVIRAGAAAGPVRTVAVVSDRTADLASRVPADLNVQTVLQDRALGTGDAVRRVFDAGLLPAGGTLLILYCDHPLLDGETVKRLANVAVESGGLVTLLTCVLPDAGAYGRVARDDAGNAVGIVERADDDPEKREGPTTEVWSGMMALDVAWARDALTRLTPSPATGELYLTELIGMAIAEWSRDGWPVAVVRAAPEIAHGVNDRVQLAEAEAHLRERNRRRWLLAGVTMEDPATVSIDEDVEIGMDTVLLPFTRIRAGTTIGRDCVIGPATELSGATIGDDVTIRSSTVTGATIHDGADVGPYSHLRPGTVIGPGAHVGNFGEFKNAHLAAGVKVGHFGYLGDVTIGEHTNIGAGTVVANFDGTRKHQTTIGANVFIGSDTVLRAPLTVGDGAATGAGSVVTRDVAPGRTVVGIPARPIGPPRRPADGTDAPDAEPSVDTEERG